MLGCGPSKITTVVIRLLILMMIDFICISSVTQLCPTLCNPMDSSTPGLPVHHQPPELTQTDIHWVSDAIQPSHPLSSPFPPAFSVSQHQGLFQWVSSLHQVAKVWEFQLQHVLSMNIKVIPLGWTGLISCSPRDSQEPSSPPQFTSYRISYRK